MKKPPNVIGFSKRATTFAFDIDEILDLLPGNVYWMDRNGIFVGCNRRLLKEIGLDSIEQYSGKTYEDLYPKDHIQKIKEIDQFVIQSNETVTLEEEEATERSGDKKIYITMKCPLHDKQGKVIGLLGVSIDITERKKAESDLELANERVEAVYKAKTEFVRNMEHDIRTPFTGVYTIVEQIAKRETDPHKKEMLSLAALSAKELLDYCNGILEFSRVESNSTCILSEKTDLKSLLSSVVTMEKPSAIAKNLELSFSYDEELPAVFFCDRNRLKRILVNLVGNAVKFTLQGFVRVSLILVEIIDDKNYLLRLCVEDSGIGIHDNQRDFIFESFSRVHPSNQGKYKGIGLGLAIVKHLVKELDGEIDLNSVPGEGTKFYFTFLLKRPLSDDLL